MINFSLTHIGVYRTPDKNTQSTTSPWLVFHVRGVKCRRTYLPDGRLLCEEFDPEPNFALRVPGMKTSFEYAEDRENWVIMFNEFPVRFLTGKTTPEIMDDKDWVPIPWKVPVDPDMLPFWQNRFESMRLAFQDPIPVNKLALKMDIISVFREFLRIDDAPSAASSPEEKLKKLLDNDPSCKYDVNELSGQCGYSRDHLRVLFYARYGLNPLEYRNKLRLSRVMELIAGSSLSLKEISEVTGFKHYTHLSLAFVEAFGISPRTAMKQYRIY